MQWIISLADQLSGPCRSMVGALSGLSGAFKASDQAAKQAQASFDQIAKSKGWKQDSAGKWRDSGGRFVTTQMLNQAKGGGGTNGGLDLGAIESRLGAIKEAAGPVISAVGSIATAFVGVVAAVGAATVATTALFAKSAISAGVFRENALLAFETMLKSGDAASRVYESAVEMAAKTPFDTQQVITAYQGLLAGGFGEGELEGVMMRISDLASVMGAEKVPQLVAAFSKIKSEGKLTGESLERLRDAGLNMGDLAANLGLSGADKIAGAKIDSVKALAAIQKTIDSRYGGLSEKRGKGLEGVWSTLQSRPLELFSAALKNADGGLSKLYATLTKVVGAVADVFDRNSDGGKKVVGFIDTICDRLNGLLTVVKGFGEGFLKGLDSTLPAAERFGKVDATNAAESFGKLGAAMGKCVGHAVTLAAKLDELERKSKTLSNAMKTIESAMRPVVIGLAAIALALNAPLILLGLVAAPFIALGAAIVWCVGKFTEFVTSVGKSASVSEAIKLALSEIGTGIYGAVSAAYSAAVNLGAQIKAGILSGLLGLGGAVQSSINSATGGLSAAIVGGATSGGYAPSVPSPSAESVPRASSESAPRPASGSSSEMGVRSAESSGKAPPSIVFQNCSFGSNSEGSLRDALLRSMLELGLA